MSTNGTRGPSRFSMYALCALILIASNTPIWAADPLELLPTDDTYLRSSAKGKPGGAGERKEFQVYGEKGGGLLPGLLRFDLKAVPASFHTAILQVKCFNAMYKGGKTTYLRCHMITSDWRETDASWDMRTAGYKWTKMGGDWDPHPCSGIWIEGRLGGDKVRTYEFDLTGAARQWKMNPKKNFGVILMIEKGTHAEMRFYSKEAVMPQQRPKLLLYYRAKAGRRYQIANPVEIPPFGSADPDAPRVSCEGRIGVLKLREPCKIKLKASGARPPYMFGPSPGSQIPGLRLQRDGTLSGKPYRAGTYTFGVICISANRKQSTAWLRVHVVDPSVVEEPKKPEPKKPPVVGKKDPKKPDPAKKPKKPKQPEEEDEEE